MNNAKFNENQAASIDPYSPVRVAKIGDKELHCETAAGAAWLGKYLHPPADRLDSYCGMPDENNQPSITVEYRFNLDVEPVSYGEPAVQANSMLMLQTGIYGAPVIVWYIRNGEVLGAADHCRVLYHETFSPDTFLTSTDTARFNYQSVTYSLDCTDFNNQGIVTVAQFRPDLDFEVQPEVDDLINRAVLTYNELPVTGQLLSMISPKTYSGLARDGAFVVQRFAQPTNAYATHWVAGSQAGDQNTPPSLFVRREGTSAASLKNMDGDLDTPLVLADSHVTWAWVLFEGLTISSEVGLPRVNVKVVSGYEFGINVDSTFSPFVRMPANYDKLALEAATRASHCMQDGMPAAMNSFGSFIVPAMKYAPAVIAALQPMLQDLGSRITRYFERGRPGKKSPKAVVVAPAAAKPKKAKQPKTDALLAQVVNRLAALELKKTPKRKAPKRKAISINMSKEPLMMA